ncbi:MAG: mitochondrial fission ELM1 family protein [Geminicoccaceae bacterium]|nr:mitochondrial fission ELM1 family protein [Geminicoccaceae bacterium]
MAPPRTWLLLGDKVGDNAQVAAVAERLGWAYETRRLVPKGRFALGKPRFSASLAHLDPGRSDLLTPPWPDLVLTIGRRPSMAALWLKARSPRTRLVLVGRPKRWPERFDLIVASPQFRVPAAPNVVRLRLPMMRADPARIAAEADLWRDEMAALPRPLTAVMVGGATRPYRFDAAFADRLIEALARLRAKDGGTLFLSTSRRTPEPVARRLAERLPEGARLFLWGRDARNPYLPLLGLADRFVVTADSVSMQMEAAALGRPLAIVRLPVRPLSGTRLLNATAKRLYHARGPIRRLIDPAFAGGYFGYVRDLAALHEELIADGRAAWLGDPFPAPGPPLPDEAAAVAARVRALVGREDPWEDHREDHCEDREPTP